MTDLTEFLPLFNRTEADIRADYDTRANAGLTTTDPDWVDTREGSLFYIASQMSVIEAAKQWDALTEFAAACNIATAWGDYLDLWAEAFNLTRTAAISATGQVTFTGTDGTLIGAGVKVGVIQTDPDEQPPEFVTTQSGTIASGTLTLNIEAVEAGSAGNVAANAITLAISPLPGVTAIANATSTSGGAEVESDEALRERIKKQLKGRGAGTQADYERWALEYGNGIGRVTVIPVWNGGGTVKVVIATADGSALSAGVVSGLQAQLDPITGQGAGQAPIGHTVTVETVTNTTITVAATITFEPGYSYDGTGGTLALRTDLTAVITDYINSLLPGEDVIYNHARATFFEIEGVLDVTALTLNAGTANITINSPATARIGTVTLS